MSRYAVIRLALAGVLLAFAAAPASAAITLGPCAQQPTFERGPGACTPSTALLGASGVAVTPDGAMVLVASSRSNALTAFDATTMSWLGCVSDDGTDGVAGTEGRCVDGDALDGAEAVAVPSDQLHAYVGAGRRNAISTFSLEEEGLPVQVGCMMEVAGGTVCEEGRGITGVRSIAFSPYGDHAYVAAAGANAVSVFDRDYDTGQLIFKQCISGNGSGGACMDGSALRQPSSIAVSPQGDRVYAATFGSRGLAVFERNDETGTLRQIQCVRRRVRRGGPCTAIPDVRGPYGVAVAPNGDVLVANVYDSVVSRLTVDPATGLLRGGVCASPYRRAGCRRIAAPSDPVAIAALETSVFVVGRLGTIAELTPDLQLKGCLNTWPTRACRPAPSLHLAAGIGLSPEETRAFVASTAALTAVEVTP